MGRAREAPVTCLLTFTLLSLAGCGSFFASPDYTRESDPGRALEVVDRRLADLAESDSDVPLLRLEQGSLRMARGRYKDAAEALRQADEHLEILDFTSNAGEMGDYLFSGNSGFYRGAPHEKILTNTLAGLCWLLTGDPEKARIESRRAGTQQEYWIDVERRVAYENPLAKLVAGLAFEDGGQWNDAYIDYKAAYKKIPLPGLEDALLRLSKRLGHSDYASWTGKFGREAPEPDPAQGEVVFFVAAGQAPVKVTDQVALPPGFHQKLDPQVGPFLSEWRLAKYPALEPRPSAFRSADVIGPDGSRASCARALDVEGQAMARFKEEKPRMLSKLFSRLVVRVATVGAATVAVYQQTKKLTKKKNRNGQEEQDDFLARTAALFTASITNTLLDKIDTPDLRCWRFLPRSYLVAWVRSPAGNRTFTVELGGSRSRTVSCPVAVEAGKRRYVFIPAME